MNDFIEIYDNSVPLVLCNELVKWFDLCSEKNFTIHNMPFTEKGKHTVHRSDEAMVIPGGIKDDHYPVSNDTLPGKICNAFWNVLSNCLDDYMRKYDMGNVIKINISVS